MRNLLLSKGGISYQFGRDILVNNGIDQTLEEK